MNLCNSSALVKICSFVVVFCTVSQVWSRGDAGCVCDVLDLLTGFVWPPTLGSKTS